MRFIARDPIVTGILKVAELLWVQSTFWRFVNALHLNVARQLLTIMPEHARTGLGGGRVAKLEIVVLIDTDTTVHTLFGNQMGGRKSYNPKNKGKKSYQPILTFLAENAGIHLGRATAMATGPAMFRWATAPSERCVQALPGQA